MIMNWKNTAENLLIALIGILFGAALTYVIITQTNKNMVAQLRPVIEQAIAKETTSIKNEFATEIKKLKAKKGSTVELQIDPTLDNKAQTNIKKDSMPEKTNFLKRWFGKKTK